MTVQELIKELQKYPDDKEVMIEMDRFNFDSIESSDSRKWDD